MGVIHFAELDEMLDELQAGQTVRVAVLDVTEQTYKKYGIRKASLGIHVRAFVGEHILSCYLPVTALQIAGGIPHREHGQFQAYTEAWDRAACYAEQVKAYLTQRGFDVRPGVIDLGNARPLPGGWSQATQASITQEVTHGGSQGS